MPHHIVIIGSGFGGLFTARALAKEDVEVTLISKTSHHLFQPLLYQVATGILSEGEIAPSTREVLASQRNATVLQGLVEDIDTDAHTVHWRNNNRGMSTSYDTLVVAAGAGQSYFGNDQFATFAPGMKTIDDALELRARIFGAFELAELETDESEIDRLLTFVVIGAGPTGVEMAGQIRELASSTLRGEFRTFDPASARVVLLDGAERPLPPFGEALGERTRRALTDLGVEVRTSTIVTDVDDASVTVRNADGSIERIDSVCKVWAAGVQGSELGRVLHERTGVALDRAGRVLVDGDLTVPGHPEVFVIGDLMGVEGVPGVAQGAIQSARFVARTIHARLRPGLRPTGVFAYRDKGSMATIARFRAVVKMDRLSLTGFPAWFAWCFLHLLYIVGFKAQVGTLMHWFISFVSGARSERTSTNQQMVARLALEQLGDGASGKLVTGQQ